MNESVVELLRRIAQSHGTLHPAIVRWLASTHVCFSSRVSRSQPSFIEV